MVNALSVKNRIDKIFDNLGSTALISSVITTSTDSYGDDVSTYGATVSITVVPWADMFSQSYQEFGDMAQGEMDVAVKADQAIDIDDKITWNSKVYKVKELGPYIISNTTLVKAVRVKSTL